MSTDETRETAAPAHPAEIDHICPSHFNVRHVGTLRCLLVAPHPRYRHYTADPERPPAFWTWTDEDAATLGRYRVNDLVRYVGNDTRWAGQEGRVLSTNYDRRVPLVVGLPGGPPGIGICFTDQNVELVSRPTQAPAGGGAS